MVTLLKWFYALSKRLYKKWLFLVLILLIPLSASALKAASAHSKGFSQIAIVNYSSGVGEKITKSLLDNDGIINFIRYKDEKTAREDLVKNRLDAVWILPKDLENRLAAFVREPDGDNYAVYIIEAQDSVKNRLANEKLSGAVFPIISKQFFLKCIRESTAFDLSHLSDEDLYECYDSFFKDGSLFKFAFPDDSVAVNKNERNYLTSPVRGLLSAITLLSGLAAAMLYISDKKKGVFAFKSSSNQILISFAFVLTALLNVGIFAFVSTFVLGLNVSLLREAVLFLIFVLNSALFCTVLSQIIKSNTFFSPVAVLITVLDVLICPVFFDFTIQRRAQFIFPNAYYINSVHSNAYLKYSLIYTAVLSLFLLLLYFKRRKA